MVAPEKSQSTSKTFAVGVRGYNQRQVDERLAELTKEVREAARSRDESAATSSDLTKALAYAQKELAETKAALARMSSSPSGAGAMAERVRMMMQLAEEEIADLRSAAEADAASTRDQADKYGHETRRTADKLAKDAEEERARLLKDAKNEIEKLSAAAGAKRVELAAAAERSRKEADAKAEAAAASKRTEADRVASEELARKKQTFEQDVARKKQETEAALAEAQRKQSEADKNRKLALDLRSKVAERIAATDVAVQEAMRLLAPADEPAAANGDRKPAPAPTPVVKAQPAPAQPAKA
jgi:cell division septum initiation protein DivIVA